jgi:hypothetical protein
MPLHPPPRKPASPQARPEATADTAQHPRGLQHRDGDDDKHHAYLDPTPHPQRVMTRHTPPSQLKSGADPATPPHGGFRGHSG